jgi:uncharacterized RDD family membrane protein YckC
LTHFDYAGLVSRLSALAIDVGVLAVTVLAVRLLPEALWNEILARPVPGWLTAGATIVATLLPWVYFTVSWWLTGQTIGDMLMGVVVLRRDGRGLSFAQAAGRALLGLALAPLWLVGLIAVLWDDQRQAWHDRVFRTVVRYTVRARAARSHSL